MSLTGILLQLMYTHLLVVRHCVAPQTAKTLPKIENDLGSRGHIERYGGMYGLCSHLFPSHQWNPYLFRIRDGYWKRKENVKAYISWLFKELGLKRLDDWYQVSGEQFVANGGTINVPLLNLYHTNTNNK